MAAEAAEEAAAEDADKACEKPAAADLESVTAERDELSDQVLRLRAELDNFRKRTAREVERIRKTAAEDLIRELLPVLDHLDLALQHAQETPNGLVEGVEMVAKQFREALGRHAVEHIPATGRPFDPNVHEAVMQREDVDVPRHTVLEEFQKGYRLGDLVLRPTKVVVSEGGPERERDPAPAGDEDAPAAPEEQSDSVKVNIARDTD